MQLEVGSVARFSGHVTTSAQNTGELDANFSGLLSATIYDRMEKVVCKDNDGSAASRNRSPFTFNERRNVVFKGNARVEKENSLSRLLYLVTSVILMICHV